MSNFVFVIDTNLQPLDPVPAGQARRLLKLRKAAVYRRYPFTIILKYALKEPKTQPYQLKIDPGSKTTGLAIVQGNQGIWGAELTHRGQQIKNVLESRRGIRRHRRHRKTRYRKPRFLNRTRPFMWLPPSVQSRVENILTWVNRIRQYVPITGISQELVRFDTQMMQKPQIKSVEYQQGELAGYQLREYLLEKWERKCVYCGEIDTRLEVDHIYPKSKGGSNRLSNLTLACHKCNQAKGNRNIKEFLILQPDLISHITQQAKQPLKDVAAVNSTRWSLFHRLQEIGLPVETGTGGKTKYNRIQFGLAKTHCLDAMCVGETDCLKVLVSQPLLITAKGWGNRQMCITNKYGFPIKHRKRCCIFFGFQTGEMVRAVLPTGKFAGVHVGRLTVRESGVFEMRTPQGKVSPVRYKYCQSIHRHDGYMYGFSTNV